MKRITTLSVGIAFLAGVSLQTALAQPVLINGAGASFPYPVYTKWCDLFHKKVSNIQVNYASQGSGAGVSRVTDGTVDFGASDPPMSDAEIKAFRDKNGYGIINFPTVLGANVPIYKLAGENVPLNFTGEALAGIFLGKITKWNDSAITGPNPGVKLPDHNIVVVHRSDASGTSYVWADFLSRVSPEWKPLVNKSPNWPVGLGGKGSEGVAGTVQNTQFSIGYVELTYAIQNKMQFGKVKNAAGQFVTADLAGVTAAAAAAKDVPDDFRASIVYEPGANSYPVSTFTYLLIPEKIKDPAKKQAIVDFLKWMLTDGQSTDILSPLSYAPLPKGLVAREMKAIAKIQ